MAQVGVQMGLSGYHIGQNGPQIGPSRVHQGPVVTEPFWCSNKPFHGSNIQAQTGLVQTEFQHTLALLFPNKAYVSYIWCL